MQKEILKRATRPQRFEHTMTVRGVANPILEMLFSGPTSRPVVAKPKVYETHEEEIIMDDKELQPGVSLDRKAAEKLLSKRMADGDDFKKFLPQYHWVWLRHWDQIVVLISNSKSQGNGDGLMGLGISRRGRYDRMNERIGVSLALTRALRSMV